MPMGALSFGCRLVKEVLGRFWEEGFVHVEFEARSYSVPARLN